jgi:hypothetical protein
VVAWVQVALDKPRALEAADVTCLATNINWSLLAADSIADMEGRRGSFQALVSGRTAQAGGLDPAPLRGTRPFRVFRLECRPVASETAPIRLAQWSLWTLQELSRIEIETLTPEVGLGGLLPLKANGILEAGAIQNLTPDVTWEISPPGAGQVDGFARFEPKVAGVVRLAARFQNTVSPPLEVQVLPQSKPDWDVTHLERQPRLDYTNPAATPTEGQSILWFGHIRNYGTGDSPTVPLEWRVDGEVVKRDIVPKIGRFGQAEVLLRTKWDGYRHHVELVVDPENTVIETSEANNRLTVASDSLAVGFWVEDATIRYFHRHQRQLGTGSNSWEDWAQRQIAARNAVALAAATPERPAELWRLDRIIVVGNGMLPFEVGNAETDPDRRDKTVQLMWGFPAYDPAFNPRFRDTQRREATNPFHHDAALLESLAAARAALLLPAAPAPPFLLLPEPVRMELLPPDPVTPVAIAEPPPAAVPAWEHSAILPDAVEARN